MAIARDIKLKNCQIYDENGDLTVTAYELSWYLQKNEISRMKLDGDAGTEPARVIRSSGISFSCPAFGFSIKERIMPQSYTALFSMLTEQAYEKKGYAILLLISETS